MRLSHKFRKLFSTQLFESLWENAIRATHPVNAKTILATVDQNETNRLRQLYPHRPGSPAINRFEDANYWVGVNVKRVQDLWLDRSPPLRILDLGCGNGFFLYVCHLFGHEGIGLDRDSNPLFRGMTDLLKVRRVIGDIQAEVPLPDLGQRFDLVTSHRVCFHRLGRIDQGDNTEWTSDQWRFFFNDIRTRFLEPDGRLLLDFNPRPDYSSFFTPELRQCFEQEGARIFRSKALLAANRGHRAKFKQTRRVRS